MRVETLPSGLVVPYTPPRQPSVAAQMEAYRKEHEACPQCGSDNYETTCMGHICGIDTNRVSCMGCGWKGIGHELVPRKVEPKKLEQSYGCICWYCHWGWPRAVREVYDRAVADFEGDSSPLEFGPSHIVWSDENFGDSSIESCIRDCDSPPGYLLERFSPEDISRVRQSLVELLAVPVEVRLCEPDDYDGNHPENFPPRAELECSRG